MKQAQAYKLDLTQMEGDGDFSCPRCGNVISPDETNEETYCILEPRANSHGLKEVEICCNICKSHIVLTGFSLLEELGIE